LTVAAEVARRGITEVLHFTSNRGLVGILASGELLSRRRLNRDDYLQVILHKNSAIRPEDSPFFDKSADWLDFVNLSISDINSYFFRTSERWHRAKDIWWVIAAFDPVIMTHEGVHFATTNNKYDYCRREKGIAGLRALFGNRIRRLNTWFADRKGRPDSHPTCEQAEVLYPGAVPTRYLRKIYVRDVQDCDRVRGWLREFSVDNVQVVVDPTKFTGLPN
jgi:hypothetical protein